VHARRVAGECGDRAGRRPHRLHYLHGLSEAGVRGGEGPGLPDLAIAEFPGVPMTYSTEELKRQVEERLLPPS
jgi:hypothetical protein